MTSAASSRFRAAPRAAAARRLSSEQLRFYFLHQMNPASPDIHICRVVRVKGPLDHARFSAAVQGLARRHDVLRSYFPAEDGDPRVELTDDLGSAVASIDLGALPSDVRSVRAERIVDAALAITEPFVLDRGPLFRVTTIRIDDDAHLVVLAFHHIIVDGTSVRLFLHEVFGAYASPDGAASGDRPAHQYREFVEWETQRLAERVAANDKEFWAKKLARPTVVDLSIGRQRPERHTHEAGTIHVAASDSLLSALRAVCRAQRVTPYVAMASVLQVFLHHVTGLTDVLFGSPVACRPRVELQTMLGVLLNWIAIRGTPNESTTFKDILTRVRADFPEAYTRQCSYDALLSAAGSPPRDPSRNPLVQVTLNYATFKALPAPPGLALSLDPIANRETHYDLSVRFEEVGDSLSLDLTYYRGAMGGGTAERVAASLMALAERCFKSPDTTLAALRSPDLAALAAEARAPAPRRVAVAATFTAEPMADTARFWLERVGLRAELDFAPLGQVFQSLLPEGSLATNKLGTNVLLVRFEDWKDPISATAELVTLLTAHAARSSADTIVVTCPPSAERRADPSDVHDRLEAELVALGAREPRVHVLSYRTVLDLYPVAKIDDPTSDAYAKAPYTEAFNVALGTAIARAIHAAVRPPPKVLLLDCDNTLWRGVVGEDGPEGLVVDEGRAALQRLALDCLEAGILVGLVSKNNPDDVWEAFAKVPGMLLRRDSIVAHRINWEPKSSNLKSLARELNLGVDSFVFVDDSAAECAEVEAGCPGALVYRLPLEAQAIRRFVRHLWPLDRRKLTEADKKRVETYVANTRREQVRSEVGDLGAFIQSLELRVDFLPMTSEVLPRAAQLTQRTNQFNATTVRRSEAELRAYLEEQGGEALAVEVSDRFGDYGIVGLVLHRARPPALEVDTFLLSCRALGRGVETHVLSELGRRASAAGLAFVELPYRKSAKNEPARRFLEAVAAAHRTSGAGEGDALYRIPVAEAIDATSRPPVSGAVADDAKPDAVVAVEAPLVSAEVWRAVAADQGDVDSIREVMHASLMRARPPRASYVGPRNELESTLAEIWSEVLLVRPIGVHDDYFAIGGDSIRSLTVVSMMREIGLKARVLDVHEHPTIAALAAVLDARREEEAAPTSVRDPSSFAGPFPLAFSQAWAIDAYARENLVPGRIPSATFHVQDRLLVQEKRSDTSLPALRRAIETIFARVGPLRSRVVATPEGIRQIESPAVLEHRVVDVSQLPQGEQERTIVRILYEDRMRPFDPTRAGVAMVRYYVAVRGPRDFELLVTAHHAFCDGWSLQTLYNHLFTLYEAHKCEDGTAIGEVERALSAVDGGFREVVHRERRAFSDAAKSAFWDAYLPERLGGHVPRLPRPSGYQPRIAEEVGWELVTRGNARAKSSRTSLKAVLLSVFAGALQSVLALDRPSVVAVVTNGRKDDLRAPMDVFGLCWTVVPVVVSPGVEASARLAEAHRDLVTTEGHARHPLAAMFHADDPTTVAATSFNFTNFHNSRWREGSDELSLTKAEAFNRFPFALNFSVRIVEQSKSVLLKVSWDPAIHDERVARRILEAFAAELVEDAAASSRTAPIQTP